VTEIASIFKNNAKAREERGLRNQLGAFGPMKKKNALCFPGAWKDKRKKRREGGAEGTQKKTNGLKV